MAERPAKAMMKSTSFHSLVSCCGFYIDMQFSVVLPVFLFVLYVNACIHLWSETFRSDPGLAWDDGLGLVFCSSSLVDLKKLGALKLRARMAMGWVGPRALWVLPKKPAWASYKIELGFMTLIIVGQGWRGFLKSESVSTGPKASGPGLRFGVLWHWDKSIPTMEGAELSHLMLNRVEINRGKNRKLRVYIGRVALGMSNEQKVCIFEFKSVLIWFWLVGLANELNSSLILNSNLYMNLSWTGMFIFCSYKFDIFMYV